MTLIAEKEELKFNLQNYLTSLSRISPPAHLRPCESIEQILCIKDLEKYAFSRLHRDTWAYFSAGANAGITVVENEKAFQHYKIRPRVLQAVGQVSLSTTIQGDRISMPICIAPTSLQCLAHPEGEKATARAATSSETCMCVSTSSTFPIEDVARSGGTGLRWFQLSILTDQEKNVHLIRLAEECGYKGLVITVDIPIVGRKYQLTRKDFKLPGNPCLANFGEKAEATPGSRDCYSASLDRSSSWDSVRSIMSNTHLPVILKGIQTAEDAEIALKLGVKGIWVSNHGERQLDTVVPTIDVLHEIVQAVDLDKIEVYLDGGIRYGTDVLKALALGARAVFVGRPVLWGLAAGGERGVRLMLELLRKELEEALILSGCKDVHSVPRTLLTEKKIFSHL